MYFGSSVCCHGGQWERSVINDLPAMLYNLHSRTLLYFSSLCPPPIPPFITGPDGQEWPRMTTNSCTEDSMYDDSQASATWNSNRPPLYPGWPPQFHSTSIVTLSSILTPGYPLFVVKTYENIAALQPGMHQGLEINVQMCTAQTSSPQCQTDHLPNTRLVHLIRLFARRQVGWVWMKERREFEKHGL